MKKQGIFDYKTVKKRVAWCFDCDSEITGNGSMVTPYHCKCSKYQWREGDEDAGRVTFYIEQIKTI
jgi:hypothetical protein